MSTQYPAPPEQYRPVATPSGIATASVVLGAVGFVVGICSVIGLVLGLVARGKAKRGEIGAARVKAGIVVSSISLGLWVLVFIGIGAGASGDDSTVGAPEATETTSASAEAAVPVETISSSPSETTPEASRPADVPVIETPAPESAASSAAPAAPGFGEAVIANDVAYTVTAFECGISQVGSNTFGRAAQGEYCQAVVDIKNQGTRPTMFNSSEARAFIGDIRYDADGQASMYAEDGNAFLTDINPGNSVTAKLYFDVPAGSRPDRIEIGGGLFSKGASIDLA